VGGLRLGYWWRYFSVWQGCDGPVSGANTSAASDGAKTDALSSASSAAPSSPPPSAAVCLIFKNHIFESWVGGVGSVDFGRSFEPTPALVMPATWAHARLTHNLAIAAVGAPGQPIQQYAMVGGQFKLDGAARCGRRSGNTVPCRPQLPPYNGLWMVEAESWRYMRPGVDQISTKLDGEELARRADAATLSQASSWSVQRARWLFNGTHPGCIEKRTRFYASMAHLGTCEFDGRLSLVRHGAQLRLYARANPAVHGQRYVQTVASDDGGRTWGRFSFVHLGGYEREQGDVYFFAGASPPPVAIAASRRAPLILRLRAPHHSRCASLAASQTCVRAAAPRVPAASRDASRASLAVSVNPVRHESLIALFPLAHKFRGCIAMAASLDGLHWSSPTPLRRCAVHGERAVHHPAQGLVMEGEHTVALYVHENVPGVTSDITPTAAQMTQFPYLRLPRPRLVRHRMPAAALRRWTDQALAELRGQR
jgi:hypothetical protein